MSTNVSLSDDPIAAIATPFGEAALGVIRTSGEGCIEAAAAVFSRSRVLSEAAGNSIHYGHLQDPRTGTRYDEVLAAVFRAPHSYTGQDSVEFSCHGSPAGLQAIMGLLLEHGFRAAEAGEFTLRAFLNGKMDLTRAEAVQEIVSAKTRTAHSLALSRLSGSIFSRIDAVKQKLVHVMAALSIQLDYPDDEIGDIPVPEAELSFARTQLEQLQATYRSGRLYQEGVRVALAGRTNAGKSSLFNLLVREDRAIVSSVHGTTRDYIETMINVSGVPVRLFDTAGLRETDEDIESEGIRRSGMIIDSAGLVLYVIDAAVGITADDQRRLEHIQASGVPCLRIWNKIDAAGADADAVPADAVAMSALTGSGLEQLHARVLEIVGGGEGISDGAVVVDSQRQHDQIERAVQGLAQVEADIAQGDPVDVIALDLQEVLNALGEITGEVTSEDILTEMFSGFCVGK